MKALLVYPVPPRTHWPVGIFRSQWVPSGVAALAGCLLRAGHEVRVVLREQHLVQCGWHWAAAEARFKRLLAEYRPELVGLSVTTPTVPEASAIAGWVKQIVGPHVLVVAGGPHPSALPEELLAECPALDACVIGEGEQTVVELAERGPRDDVAGLVFRRDGQVVRTPARKPLHDLDMLPALPYELFDMPFHTTPDRWLIRWLKRAATNLRTSRGCVGACTFCAGQVAAGVGVRFHSVERVADEASFVVAHFGVQAIHFEDDSIGTKPGRLRELCAELRRRELERRVQWDCCLRVDQAEADLLREMKASGCIQVEYGFESGSDAALRELDKRTTAELNCRAVELTRRAGLRIFADIMIGLPGETPAQLGETRRFLRAARPEVISWARLTPLPGTPLYDQLPPEQRRRLGWADYAYFDGQRGGVNLTAMPDAVFAREARRMRKQVFEPQLLRALLRDAGRSDRALRRRWRGQLARFVIRHPLRALRVPWS